MQREIVWIRSTATRIIASLRSDSIERTILANRVSTWFSGRNVTITNVSIGGQPSLTTIKSHCSCSGVRPYNKVVQFSSVWHWRWPRAVIVKLLHKNVRAKESGDQPTTAHWTIRLDKVMGSGLATNEHGLLYCHWVVYSVVEQPTCCTTLTNTVQP